MAFENPIRVLIVEDNESDHELSRVALSTHETPGFDIVAAKTLESALSILSAGCRVDAVLLDLNLPDSSGLETCRRLLVSFPNLPIIVLTGLDDEDLALDAVAMGAQDFLTKGTVGDGRLSRAIRFAIERADWDQPQVDLVVSHHTNQSVQKRLNELTPRERETLELLIHGISLKHLANRFGISPQTAAKHRTRVLEKMHVNNDVELVRLVLGGAG